MRTGRVDVPRLLVAIVAALLSADCGPEARPGIKDRLVPQGPEISSTSLLSPAAPGARSGPVRIDGHAFADDHGTWNPLGASLFWALWGERHDPERLDRNLVHLAQHHVDYVRVLGMVGSQTWADRLIDPRASDYWDVVDRLMDRLQRHGLRAQVTIFADAQVMMPDIAGRAAFAAAWADLANRRRDRIMLFEVANEGWQNGFPDPAEVRKLGDLLRSRTAVPIALSAPADGQVFRMYAGWPGVSTLHYDRDVSTRDGPWRPVWQPWTWPDVYRTRERYRGPIPPVVVNNEPIGPQASLAADDAPMRIAMAYATTFVAGNAAYVYHTGAGIRGGGSADRSRGRRANVDEYNPSILDALGMLRRLLPPGLANWTRHAPQSASMPWDGSQAAVERGDIVGAYAATSADELVAVVLGASRPHAIAARRSMDLVLVHPVSGDSLARVSLTAGQSWTMPAVAEGYVVRGVLR